MKGPSWKVDETNIVALTQGIFGRQRVFLNGREVASKVPWRKTSIPFSLEDGRKAEVLIVPSGFVPEKELRVEGQLILSELDRKQIACLKCGSQAKAGGKFCEKCGAELPGAETQLRMKKLKEARGAIGMVTGLFLLSGVIMFFVQKNTSEASLRNLAQFKDSDLYPQLIAGKQFSVGELRHDLASQPMSVLVTNIVLAAIMFALYQYAKKSPLVAIIMATGVYASVQVVSAILNPMSMGQGIYMKIIMLGLLVKGIRSALELRKVSV